MVVPGRLGSAVCPPAGVLAVVLLAGRLVAWRVALLARSPGTVRSATVLEGSLVVGGVPAVGGGGLGRGPEDMVSRIQPFSLVIRV